MTGYLNYLFPKERFTLLTGKESLKSYRFGTKKGDHPFCSECGLASFYHPRDLPDLIAVLFPKGNTKNRLTSIVWIKVRSQNGIKQGPSMGRIGFIRLDLENVQSYR